MPDEWPRAMVNKWVAEVIGLVKEDPLRVFKLFSSLAI